MASSTFKKWQRVRVSPKADGPWRLWRNCRGVISGESMRMSGTSYDHTPWWPVRIEYEGRFRPINVVQTYLETCDGLFDI